MSSNVTIWPSVDDPVTQINCVYSISGSYGLLPRLLYYVTLVAAIFGRAKEWLIIGALVSALTYSGTAAIHLMALVTSKSEVFDLDIMAAWAVLSTGALAYIGLIHWSSTLRNSRARVVMICWGMLVGMGLIFGRTELFDTPLSDPEPACYSSSGMLLEYPIQLLNPEFNCTYQCFSVSKPMRHRYEITAVPHRVLDNQYTRLSYVLVGPIQFAAYAALSWDAVNHTPSYACTLLVMRYLIRPGQREEFTKTVYKTSMAQWYGGYFALLGFVKRSRWGFRKLILSTFSIPWLMLGFLIDVLCLPLMVCNIVLNEISLLSGNLPTNEANVAIGQWGPFVSSMLVVIAAIINKGLEMQEARKLAKEKNGLTEEVGMVPPDVERAMMDSEQELGVVKPKLAHVQTLQDMDDLMKRPK